MTLEAEGAYPLEKLSYELNGLAMKVHRELGHGFSEVVYKDALEIEFNEAGIQYEREKSFKISYRGTILKHKYRADFIACENIVVEVKAQGAIVDGNRKQVINYLAVTKCKLGLIYNFGTPSLGIRRVVL